MSTYSITVTLKLANGNSSSYNTEVNLPDRLDSKIGNSANKNEILAALEAVLPQMLGGADWRKNKAKLISYNNVRKA